MSSQQSESRESQRDSESNVVTLNEVINAVKGSIESEMPQPLEEVPLRHAEAPIVTPGSTSQSLGEIENPSNAAMPTESKLEGLLKNIAELNDSQQAQLRYLLNHSDAAVSEQLSELSLASKKRRLSNSESVASNSARLTRLRITPPEKYNGKDRRVAEDFIQHISYFRLTEDQLPSEIYKVDLFGTFLKDAAWDWYVNYIETVEHKANPSWITIREKFRASFASTQRKRQALDQLELVQGDRDLLNFNIDFQASLHRYNSLCLDPKDRISLRAALEKYLTVVNVKWIKDLQNSGFILNDQVTLSDVIQQLENMDSSNKRYASFLRNLERERNYGENLYYRKIRNSRRVPKNPKGKETEFKPPEKKKFTGVCNVCNRPGHKAMDCKVRNHPFNPDAPDIEPCSHCKRKGHQEKDCWLKYPELRPKSIKRLKTGPRVTIKQRIHQMKPGEKTLMDSESPESKLKKKKIDSILNCKKCQEVPHTLNEAWLDKHYELHGDGSLVLKGQINKSNTYINLLIDSGAPYPIIRKDVALRLGLKIARDPNAKPLQWGNGESAATEAEVTYPVALTIQGHTEMITFSVIESGDAEAMLGYSWLTRHCPTIDWKSGLIQWNSEHCRENCLTPNKAMIDRVKELFPKEKIEGMMEVPIVKLNENNKLIEDPEETRKTRVYVVTCSKETSKEHDYYVITAHNSTDDHNERINAMRLFSEYHDAEDAFIELTEEDRASFPQQYKEYVDVFSKNKADILPEHRQWDIPIETDDKFTPKWGPLYNLSQEEMKLLKEYIDDNLQKGFIRPSSSPCGAPVLFVPKKNGKLRLCVDYRALNSLTIKDRYPLPLIDNLIDQLRGATIYTALDLKGAYNLVRIKEGDEWKTAFRTRYGHYEYVVMPFGLTNAPATFQRMMNDILREHLDKFVIVYLDDILIYSKGVEEHEKHVKMVLELLRKHKLYCEYSKCKFHQSEIDYLGYVISPNGLAMSQEKIKAILEWKQPVNKVGVQSFLGFANFYRRFIKNYSKVAAPLHELVRDGGIFEWNQRAQEAFDTLKQKFISAPILCFANFSSKFIVETDASDFAIGCVLSQYIDGVLHPIAFYSRKLSDVETRWEIHDKELYGIITALKVWRHYLIGRGETEIYTDHRNLQYFMKKQKLNARQLRWMIFLADYEFTIYYKEGSKMGKADALSRRAEFNSVERQVDTSKVLLDKSMFGDIESKIKSFSKLRDEAVYHTHSINMLKMKQCQRVYVIKAPLDNQKLMSAVLAKTPTFPVFQYLIDPTEYRPAKYKEMYLEHGLVYSRGKVFIEDESLKAQILQLMHDSPLAGHPGIEKTSELVKREFHWKGIDKYIKDYVASCDMCQRTKVPRHKPYGLIKSLPVPTNPWKDIGMDFVGPLPMSKGYDMMLIVICRLTKQAHFIPCVKTRTVTQVVDMFMQHIFRLHGIPSTIVSDRDSIFTSHHWQEFVKMLSVQHNLSTAYHPKTDGVTERVIQTLKQYLRNFINYQQKDWVDYIPFAEFAYNNSMHSSIQMSPFKANYGYDFSLTFNYDTEGSVPAVGERLSKINEIHEQLKTSLKIASDIQKKYADRLLKEAPEFEKGEQVWLLTTNIKTTRPNESLDYKRLGPFTILEKIGEVNYRLQLPKSMQKMYDVFHVSLLEKYHPNQIDQRQLLEPPPIIIDNEEEYEVEKILDSRVKRNQIEYLIDWKGYGIDERCWVNSKEINAKELIEEFHRENPNAKGLKDLANNKKRKRVSFMLPATT